jgi:hypothetical protein
VWRFGLALINSLPLLGWGEFEVAHLHRRAQICCCLPQSGALVPTPEAVVDHDVVTQFKGAQPDLDESSFDHVTSRWRIVVPVEGLHPFVLRETKGFLLDLDARAAVVFPVHGSPTVRNSVARFIITRIRPNAPSLLTPLRTTGPCLPSPGEGRGRGAGGARLKPRIDVFGGVVASYQDFIPSRRFHGPRFMDALALAPSGTHVAYIDDEAGSSTSRFRL